MSVPQYVGDKANIILLVTDDFGYGDLGGYGSKLSTSEIDRLWSTFSGIRYVLGTRFRDILFRNMPTTGLLWKSLLLLGGENTSFISFGDRGRSIGNLKFFVDAAHVVVHGMATDVELVRNFLFN